jgi:hypothetical protein
MAQKPVVVAAASTPDHAAAVRLAELNTSRVALESALSDENLALVDKGIKGELRASNATRIACWTIVQQCRDLGVPSNDTGVTRMIQTVLREHSISKFGDDAKSPERIKWDDWSKCIQRAVYHAVSPDKFGISLKNNPEFRIGGSGAQATKSGAVSTTTLLDAFKTASKLLAQFRMLNQTAVAGELIDLLVEHYPEFKEVNEKGEAITK